MLKRGHIALGVILCLFGWAMALLFHARFEVGDAFPRGSSLRSDALGTRALFEALGEVSGMRVTRHHGRRGELAQATDATIVVNQLRLTDLIAKAHPLITEITAAVRGGARLVVALDDAEGQVCRKAYCNTETPSHCFELKTSAALGSAAGAPAVGPSGTAGQPSCAGQAALAPDPTSAPEAQIDQTCGDAALGLWGFEIGGSRSLPTTEAEKDAAAPVQLSQRIPWLSPATFIALDSAFRVIYRGGDAALIVERELGKGSLVLMNEGYLLSNEAQRLARQPELLVWLMGGRPRVIFEESHLGLKEERGILSLIRELRLEGAVWAGLVVFLLYVWKVTTPLSCRLEGSREPSSVSEEQNSSPLHALLRRTLSPDSALRACVEEARQARLAKAVERAAETALRGDVETFNRVFSSDQERPIAR